MHKWAFEEPNRRERIRPNYAFVHENWACFEHEYPILSITTNVHEWRVLENLHETRPNCIKSGPKRASCQVRAYPFRSPFPSPFLPAPPRGAPTYPPSFDRRLSGDVHTWQPSKTRSRGEGDRGQHDKVGAAGAAELPPGVVPRARFLQPVRQRRLVVLGLSRERGRW